MAAPNDIRRKPCPPAIRRDAVAADDASVLAGTPDAQPTVNPLHAQPVAAAQGTDDAGTSSSTSWVDQSSEAASVLPPTDEKPVASFVTSTWWHWRWELFCALISSASFVTIIILLRSNQGELLSRWKGVISVNAYVAILTAVFKGAVGVPLSSGLGQLKWLWLSKRERSLADLARFDKASTGAWDSLVFLGSQLRHRNMSLVASLGAVIIVLSIAVDPFTQAAVSFEPCQHLLSEAASLPRLNEPVDSVDGPYKSGVLRGHLLKPFMAKAFLAGIYTPPANSSVTTAVSCPTGNCTFATSFTTLSMCHSCQDISDQVEEVDGLGWALHKYNLTVQKLHQITSDDAFGPEIYSQTVSMSTSANTTDSDYDFGLGTKDRLSLMDFQLLARVCKYNGTAEPSARSCDNTNLAVDCNFTPCVKTYTANVTNHIYSEIEVPDSRQYLHPEVMPADGFKIFQLAVNNASYYGTKADCSASQVNNGGSVPIYGPESYAAKFDKNSTFTPSELFYPPECVFHVGWGQTYAMKVLADTTFGNLAVRVPYRTSVIAGEPWLVDLWDEWKMNLSKVDEFAGGIATSISGEWRRNPVKLGYEQVLGQTHRTEPCIRVHWAYLTFPASILVGELLFLAVAILLSRLSSWNGDWKSSNVPQLFQNLGIEAEAGRQGQAQLYKRAEGIWVNFSNRDGRWALDTA